MALQVRAGDQLRVEWLDPTGAVSTTADYGELPSAGELCLTTQLPIAGFAPASQPGNWTVRAVANGTVAFSRSFTIAASVDNGGPVVNSVTWSGQGSGEKAQETDFKVLGKNFQPGSNVLIAQYKPAGGWTYLASLQPSDTAANQLTVHYAGLPANEYWVIVESPDGRMSRRRSSSSRLAAISCPPPRVSRGLSRKGRTARSRIGATACTLSISRRARGVAWWR